MKIDLYSNTSKSHLSGDFFFYYPPKNSCATFISECSNLSYICERLSSGTYSYFEPNVDGSYLTTLDINSTEDFYNYPELFI